jgi:nucleotide-binding universal stress UspA family protein
MFHHIMVPLDGSLLAERALPYATQIAIATGATVHLVYVAELLSSSWSPFPAFVTDAVWEAELQWITEYLARIRMPLAAAGVQMHTECLVEVSGVAALLGYERAASIDLVVICAHRHAGLISFTPRSLAERLRCRSAVPVLQVPVSGETVALKQGLTLLDGSARADDGQDVAPVVAASKIRVLSKPSNRDEQAGRKSTVR